MAKLFGNRGEWSEPYVLLKLLGEGRLYAADENLRKLSEIYFPILNILRQEEKDRKINFSVKDTEKIIEIYFNDDFISEIPESKFIEEANYLYQKIIDRTETTFEVEKTEAFLNSICITKLKAPNEDKTDITLRIHDINTGHEPICGFSIKSRLGNPSTLINASEATNFIYEIDGLPDSKIDSINGIESNQKIIDRIRSIIQAGGHFKFYKMNSSVYANNLMFIDSRMPELLSYALLYSYADNVSECSPVITLLGNRNPLHYPSGNYYEYKFKKLLCSAALGMMPSKPWSGKDEANGGYIIVCESGDVLAYHIYNRDSFESYLLANTKFERASTSRHNFATLYKENGKTFIKLNLQIRFIK